MADIETGRIGIVSTTGASGILPEQFPVARKIGVAIETQEKTVSVSANGTSEVTPDSGKALSKVTVNANVPAYGITATCENITPTEQNPIAIAGGSTATLEFKANNGYQCPTTAPTVTGATVTSYTVETVVSENDTAILVIGNATENVSFTISGVN